MEKHTTVTNDILQIKIPSIDPSVRYKHNPYVNKSGLNVPVAKKMQTISTWKGTKGSDISIVNNSTGEVVGTAVTTYKKVDKTQFIKLFTQNIGLAFDLTSSGIKAFTVLIWAVQNKMGADCLTLDIYTLEEFLEGATDKSGNKLKLSPQTFKKGLTELCKAQIIAKAIRQGDYYINPYFIFNGNRLTFSTTIEVGEDIPDPKDFNLISQEKEDYEQSNPYSDT